MESKRFEFVLYKNEPTKIICARNFSVDNFNPKVINSLEIKTMIDNIVGINNGPFGLLGIIPLSIQKKSVDNMWSYYNPLKEQEVRSEDLFENEDIFYLEVRQKDVIVINGEEIPNDKLIGKGSFSGNYFPRHLRNRVDIKSIIPEIMDEIKTTLSSKKTTNNYALVTL